MKLSQLKRGDEFNYKSPKSTQISNYLVIGVSEETGDIWVQGGFGMGALTMHPETDVNPGWSTSGFPRKR